MLDFFIYDFIAIEQFQRYQEETFDAFCKAVIRNESANAHNEMDMRAEKEINLSCLSPTELQSIQTEDIYHTYCKQYHVRGNIVCVYDPTLGEILQHISPQLLHINRRTVDNRRKAALQRLRELLEEVDDA